MLAVIKGAGDLASGIACKLYLAGIDIIMTEIANPTTIRHTVAFSSAVFDESATVENITSVLAKNNNDIDFILNQNKIAVIIDEYAKVISQRTPDIVIDAIIAKKNTNTKIEDAPIVIGVGPGFKPGIDCHCAIETKRGHYLGKVLYDDEPEKNTGKPGNIAGFTEERIIRAPCSGIFKPICKIGDLVSKGDTVAFVEDIPVHATISGILRGMLKNNIFVHKGMKSGDIDPRAIKDYCYSISDKARAVAGGVLEAVFSLCSSGRKNSNIH